MNPRDPDFPTHRAPSDLLARGFRRAELLAPATPRLGRAPPAYAWAARALLAAACFLLGVGVGRVGSGPGESKPAPMAPSAAAVSSTREAPVESAPGRVSVPATVPVRFVLPAAGARRVAVAGSWNEWSTSAAPMVHGTGDVFYTIIALPPGEYEYQFVVDGERWTPDPAAPLARDDGYGQQNSVLTI